MHDPRLPTPLLHAKIGAACSAASALVTGWIAYVTWDEPWRPYHKGAVGLFEWIGYRLLGLEISQIYLGVAVLTTALFVYFLARLIRLKFFPEPG